MEFANGAREHTEVREVGLGQDMVEQSWPQNKQPVEVLDGFVARINLVCWVPWGTIKNGGQIRCRIGHRLAVRLIYWVETSISQVYRRKRTFHMSPRKTAHLHVSIESPLSLSQYRVARHKPTRRSGMLRAMWCMRSPGQLCGMGRMRGRALKRLGLLIPVS